VAYEAHVEGVPSEEVLRRLIEEARAAGADRIEIETTHEDGDAWIRAGFTELARLLEAPLAALEAHLGTGKEPSYGSIHVQTDDVDAVVRAVRGEPEPRPGLVQGGLGLLDTEAEVRRVEAREELSLPDRAAEVHGDLAHPAGDLEPGHDLLVGGERPGDDDGAGQPSVRLR